jgi:hypothetical protein
MLQQHTKASAVPRTSLQPNVSRRYFCNGKVEINVALLQAIDVGQAQYQPGFACQGLDGTSACTIR